MSKRGLFLVLEGIEGAGKTTQARLLSGWLDGLGVEHEVSREPGGTELGEAVREILLEGRELSISAESELFLMLAARAAFVREFVRPRLERGAVVLTDRYDLSTLAYQGYGRGLDLEAVGEANALATGGLRPDLCLLLDVDVESGVARRRREGKAEDRIESEGLAFLRRVREGYLALAEEDQGVAVVDGRGSCEEVQDRLRSLLRARFPETFGDGPV